MKYAVMDYQTVNGQFNIGDYVQSLAAAQYFPEVNEFINREQMDAYDGERVKMILNGWFMHEPKNWPPSEKIQPLFVSFHINRPHLEKMLTPQSVEYFKRHQPIGCRDHHTASQLRSKGVDAYYSGCLTTTLGKNFESGGARKGVLFVDVMHSIPDFSEYKKMPMRYLASNIRSGNLLLSTKKKRWISELSRMVPAELINEVEFIKNSIDGSGLEAAARFDLANDYLKKLASARIVFTSRIHCALPCLAMNTPVIFVKAGQKSESNILRFKGIIDHMNVLDYDGDVKGQGFSSRLLSMKDIDVLSPPLNPNSFSDLVGDLVKRCEGFVIGK